MSELSKVTLLGIPSERLPELWQSIVPYILKTLKHCDNKYDINSLHKCLENREMQLWIAYQDDNILSYAITQIQHFPTHQRLCIMFAGGTEMFKWLHLINELREWGKYHGCTEVESYGRSGWEKELAPYGFQKIQTIYKATI